MSTYVVYYDQKEQRIAMEQGGNLSVSLSPFERRVMEKLGKMPVNADTPRSAIKVVLSTIQEHTKLGETELFALDDHLTAAAEKVWQTLKDAGAIGLTTKDRRMQEGT